MLSHHYPKCPKKPMDLITFESLQDKLKAHPARAEKFSIDELPSPRSIQVIVPHPGRPRVFHHLIIYPCDVPGMVVKKSWTHDRDVGIETPTQGQVSIDTVLRQIENLLSV